MKKEKPERLISDLPVSVVVPIDGNIPILVVVPEKIGVPISGGSHKNFNSGSKKGK